MSGKKSDLQILEYIGSGKKKLAAALFLFFPAFMVIALNFLHAFFCTPQLSLAPRRSLRFGWTHQAATVQATDAAPHTPLPPAPTVPARTHRRRHWRKLHFFLPCPPASRRSKAKPLLMTYRASWRRRIHFQTNDEFWWKRERSSTRMKKVVEFKSC